MAHFDEQTGQPYDWNEGGVYVVEREDPVDGGLDGVSNRQGRELTRRTRNLHTRLATSEGEINTLQEELPIATEAAKRSAIEHTDGQVAAVRDELALGDQAAVSTAKAYADRIVAALVDNSPELLNTLEELASALGGDPNFATTVMTAIGERVTTDAMSTALAEKAEKNHRHATLGLSLGADLNTITATGVYDVLNGVHSPVQGWVYVQVFRHSADSDWVAQTVYSFGGDNLPGRTWQRNLMGSLGWSQWLLFYNDVNLGFASQEAAGLMDPADKTKLDGMETILTGKFGNYTGAVATPNNSPLNSFFRTAPGATDTPVAGEYAVGFTVAIDNNTLFKNQMVYCKNQWWQRYQHNGSWGAWQMLLHSGNLDKAKLDTLPAKIIRGSVTASGGNGGGNAYNVGFVAGEEAVVRVTHSLGTHAYSATASTVSYTDIAYSDNVVSAWRKTANYVDFVVTRGPDNSRELCAFDFIIIPH